MRRFNRGAAIVIWGTIHEGAGQLLPNPETWIRTIVTQGKSMAWIAARGPKRQAFFEYNPVPMQVDDPERVYRPVLYGPPVEVFALDMRSYRGPNSENRQPVLDESAALMGRDQIALLKERLAASPATWKVIASDMPIGLIVRDASFYEAVANAENVSRSAGAGDGGPAALHPRPWDTEVVW